MDHVTPQGALFALGARAEDRHVVPTGAALGRVSIVHGALAEVIWVDDDGVEQLALVQAAGSDPHPVAGDWVGLRDGAIVSISPRRSELRRPGATKGRIQVLAANIDLVLVMVPVDRPLNVPMLESLTVMAFDSRAAPVVVLTKADQADDLTRAAIEARQAVPDLPVVVTSAVDGTGIAALEALLGPGVTAVMLGASGVGKTSLLNTIDDRDEFTRPVGPKGEGRHSTTTRRLHRLRCGGVLLDIPGIRLLDAVATDEALAGTFPDIDEIASRCRFRDCAHMGDKGCAVEAAVRSGELPARRLERWRQLQTGIDGHPSGGRRPITPDPSHRRTKRRELPVDDEE